MIDVVYILKSSPSKNGDNEIRYSLRSLEKFCPDVARVFITGGIPSFVDRDKIIHTAADDIGVPAVNHWWKVRQTIEKTDISNDFILMNDDFFFVKQTELSKYPLYFRGELIKELDQNSIYKQMLYNTRLCVLNNGGYSFLDFSVHCPIRYNRKQFLKLNTIFEEVKTEKPAFSVRSVYGNLFALDEDRIYRKDIKIRRSTEKVEDVAGEADCFSVSDDVFECDTLRWLKENLPKKSKWEK